MNPEEDRLDNRMTIDEFKIEVLPLKQKLFRIAARILGDHDDAQDAVQDAMIRLWNRRQKLREYKNIEAIAVVTTRNLCLDRIRSKSFRHENLENVHLESYEMNPAIDTEIRDTVNQVHLAVQQLPELQKTIMQLRDIEEMEFEEIASMLDMNINAIRVNLSRARKKVRDTINKYQQYEVARN